MKLLKEIFQRALNKIAFIAPGGWSIRPWLHRLRGVKIGKNVWIGQYVYFDELHSEKISIGDNTSIGLRVSLFTHFYWGRKFKNEDVGSIEIGKNVFIGPNCVILPNVHIAEGSVIKAGSVVGKNVPANVYWGTDSGRQLAKVTVPLTKDHSYQEFIHGLRPIRQNNHFRTPPSPDDLPIPSAEDPK